jgi:hypothetical protein
MEKYSNQLTYVSSDFQPKMSFHDFESVYHNPSAKQSVLADMAKSTAEHILRLL